MREPTQRTYGEGRRRRFQGSNLIPSTVPPGWWRQHVCTRRCDANTGDPKRWVQTQPDAREGQAGLLGETDRFVVPSKRGNACGGKGPDFGNGPAVLTAGDWRKPTTLLTELGCTLRDSHVRRRFHRGPVGGQLVGEPDAGNPHVQVR